MYKTKNPETPEKEDFPALGDFGNTIIVKKKKSKKAGRYVKLMKFDENAANVAQPVKEVVPVEKVVFKTPDDSVELWQGKVPEFFLVNQNQKDFRNSRSNLTNSN